MNKSNLTKVFESISVVSSVHSEIQWRYEEVEHDKGWNYWPSL